MNKVDVGKALETLRADMASTTAEAQPAPPPVRGRPEGAVPPLRRFRGPLGLLPDEFPPGVHPDDWEPDWEDEPESARAIGRIARFFEAPPT